MCITLNKEAETIFKATKNFNTTRKTTSPKMQCQFGPNASRKRVRNYISQNALLLCWFSFHGRNWIRMTLHSGNPEVLAAHWLGFGGDVS